MKLEDIIHEDLSNCGNYEWVLKSTKMNIFGETIEDHHDD
jgi:hypothetical protein